MLFNYFFGDRKGIFLITQRKEHSLVTLFIHIFMATESTRQIFIEYLRYLHTFLLPVFLLKLFAYIITSLKNLCEGRIQHALLWRSEAKGQDAYIP